MSTSFQVTLRFRRMNQNFLFLEGEGSNGKSVYCAGLEAMLGGKQNVSHVALEVVVGGACSGSRARGNDTGSTPTEGLGRAADVVDCCGSCTDVILGGGGAAVPPPDLSGKQKLSRPTDEAVDPIDAPGNSLPRISGTRFSSSAPFPERPSTGDSVVLRL